MDRHATDDDVGCAHAAKQFQSFDQSCEYRLSFATQECCCSIGECRIRIHHHDRPILFLPANLTTELVDSLHKLRRREPTHTTQNSKHRFAHFFVTFVPFVAN